MDSLDNIRFIPITLTACNDNVGPDDPLRLADAVRYAFPHGGVTVSTLRAEARRGNLVITRLRNADFTTLRHIEGMKEKCRVNPSRPDFGSVQQATTAKRLGSSFTVEGRSQLVAARALLRTPTAR
jgi:hypothetical protein